ncbi:MAG: zinc ribbon domain-containing protein [Nitrososphaerota archaeon]
MNKSSKANLSISQGSETIQCPKCYAINPSEALHCLKCGSNLKKEGEWEIEGKVKSIEAVNYIHNNLLYESVLDKNGFPMFLTYDGRFQAVKEIMDVDERGNSLRIVPIHPKSLPYIQYSLHEGWDEDVDPRELYKTVKSFLTKRVVVDPEALTLLTIDLFLGYLQDLMETLHYIFLIGDTNSGKSKALRVFNLIAFRPLWTVDLPAADLYEYLGTEERPTKGIILEDEADDLISKEDKRRIWKVGFQRGAKVSRILISEKTGKRKQVHYNAFCFKMAASERLPTGSKAKGLLERFIIIPMVYGIPERQDLDDSDRMEASKIRLSLLKLRLKLFKEGLSDVEPYVLISENGSEYKYPLMGRERELWYPFLKVANILGCIEEARRCAGYFIQAQRKSRLETLEAYIAKSLHELMEEEKDRVSDDSMEFTLDEIFEKLTSVVNGEVSNDGKIISDVLDEDVSRQKLGRRLKEAFKGERGLKREGGEVKRSWKFKNVVIEKMYNKYFSNLAAPSVTSVTDVTLSRKGEKQNFSSASIKEEWKILTDTPQKIGYNVTSVTKSPISGYTINSKKINEITEKFKPYGEAYSLALFKILKEKSVSGRELSFNADEVYEWASKILTNKALMEEVKKDYDFLLKSSKPLGRMKALFDKDGRLRLRFELDFEAVSEAYMTLSSLRPSEDFRILAFVKDKTECEICGNEAIPYNKVNMDGKIVLICENCYAKIKKEREKKKNDGFSLTMEERIKMAKKIYDELKLDDGFCEKQPFMKTLSKALNGPADEFFTLLVKRGFIIEPREGWIRWIDR